MGSRRCLASFWAFANYRSMINNYPSDPSVQRQTYAPSTQSAGAEARWRAREWEFLTCPIGAKYYLVNLTTKISKWSQIWFYHLICILRSYIKWKCIFYNQYVLNSRVRGFRRSCILSSSKVMKYDHFYPTKIHYLKAYFLEKSNIHVCCIGWT